MLPKVAIEDRRVKKAHLGGWINKITGVEYLNAISQTGPPPKHLPWNEQCSRETQSVELKDQSSQSSCHKATQMWRDDCNVSNALDKFMTVKPYESYDEMRARLRIDDRVRTIQRYYRAYRILKYIRESAAEHRRMAADCKRYEEEKLLLFRKKHHREILRKIHPRSRADFDMLYNLVDTWRFARFDEIRMRLFEGPRRAENYAILENTVRMLRDIDRHRQRIVEENRRKKRVRFLTVNCKPIRWNGYKMKPVEMVTLKTQRAREFGMIYDDLSNNDATLEERVELLVMLKSSLKLHSCQAVAELIYVLDQEISLLSTGIRGSLLRNLRERVTNAFLYFVNMSCACSTEIVDNYGNKIIAKVENEELQEPLETKILFCTSCERVLPSNRFTAHIRMRNISRCTSCSWLQCGRNPHVDYDPYLLVLNGIRADERRRNCFSSLAFVMQAQGIYHLVNNIWHDRSIVSECDDLSTLRLVRFYVDEEWSPWNCILLTEEEAKTHYCIKDVRTVYSGKLLQKIFLSHQLAKIHFRELIIFEKRYRESSRFYMVQDREKYEAPTTVENYDVTIMY